jgi:DNA mismatch repair protein MutL
MGFTFRAMPKIHVLSDILASQVAAGEVVERPASVVKELVENSIDAGAGEIRVDVDQGGSALIRVSDDGCGMSREDALLSLERHATSKLRTAGDLAAIRTLGFRGEAVPSIASVSRFRLVTRERDATAGTEILVDGGKLRDVREAGCAPGTVIEAKALFFNMPARRKFLRAESTESAHVEHQLRLHALAAPNIRFRLRRDDREVFDLPPVARAVDRVRQLLGNDLARELVTLPETRGNGIVVEGFVLPAAHARKGRRHQFVFLNGRPVEDAVISRGLADGFRSSLTDGLHPAAWLWIDLEPTLVDVNVHPAKREVRFHRPVDVRETITEAVLAALKPKPAPVTQPPAHQVRPAAPPPAWERPAPQVPTPPAAAPAVPAWLARVQPPLPLTESVDRAPASTPPIASPTLPEPAGVSATVPDSRAMAQAAAFRLIDVLLKRWVLMESAEGLVLLDPRAATERILYEVLLRQQGENMAVQRLLVPVLLETDPRDFDLVLRERPAFAAAGIEIEPFGGNTLQVQSLPACLTLEDPRATLGSMLDELIHEHSPGPRFAFERVARSLVKRAAAGARPRLAETQALLVRLFACDLPYCAPDGRPTLTEIGVRELERRFGGK